MKKKSSIIILTCVLFCFGGSYAQTKPDLTRFGKSYGMVLISNMPYLKLTLGKADGFFVLDFGTNGSSLDTNGFDCHAIPQGTIDATHSKLTIDPFEMYGGSFYFWFRASTVNLPNVKQAGILGTDLFMQKVYTLDYMGQFLYESDKSMFPSDGDLQKAGFKASSTKLHYSSDFNKLEDPAHTFNIPAVPVKIGSISALAEIDPGYDDGAFYHTVNINNALYQALLNANIKLISVPGVKPITSYGGNEPVKAFRLAPGFTFSVIAIDGTPIILTSDVFLFLKQGSPEVIKAAGGIGAWNVPGAQFGASFLKESKVIVFDPFSSQVWFYTK